MGFSFTRFILGLVMLLTVESVAGQIEKIKLQIKYDTTDCKYGMWLHITQGSAFSPVDLTQFNASITVVVPSTDSFQLGENFQPLSSLDGLPMNWKLSNISLSPAAQPQSNFYTAAPKLSPVSRYNSLNQGDSIKLYNFIVFDKVTKDERSPVRCGEAIRMFRNWPDIATLPEAADPNPDPTPSEPGMNGGDFNNGFTIGNYEPLYTGTLKSQTPPKPASNIELICTNGIHIETSTKTSKCQSPLTYNWQGPNGYGSTNEDVIIPSSTVFDNGVYTLTVTDALGCTEVTSVTVTGRADAGPDQSLCGTNSTTLNGVGAGGSTWVFAGGPAGSTITTPTAFNTTVTFNPTAYGTFKFAFGNVLCRDTVIIERKSKPTITFTGDNKFCPGGSATITASGGINYIWAHSGETSPTVTISSPGSYVVTVSDSPTCLATSTIVVTQHVPQTGTISGVVSFCEGKSTKLTVSGGITYVWSPGGEPSADKVVTTGGTYEVLVTDINGCTSTVSRFVTENPLPIAGIDGNLSFCAGGNTTLTGTGGVLYKWTPSATTQNITVSVPGTVTVTVSDANQCTSTASEVIVRNELPIATIDGSLNFCAGGSTTLTANGGNTYAWSIPATSQSVVVTTAGPVAVTVTDVNGCKGSISKNLLINPLPIAKITGVLKFCEGGSTLLLGQGAPNLSWSVGGTAPTVTVNNSETVVLTVTDNNGCSGTDSKDVVEYTNPTAIISGDLFYCAGYSTTLTGSGGTALSWGPYGASTSISALAGPVTLTVSDVNGCTGSTSATVVERPSPIAVITGNNKFCEGDKTVLTATGGTTYLWSVDLKTTQSIDVTSAATVTVTVTNSNQCTDTESLQVSQYIKATALISGSNSFCEGSKTTLTATGGTSYKWSVGNQTTASIDVMEAATVSVTVTDANGCTDSDEMVVTKNLNPIADISGVENFCTGGKTTLTASGGISYAWSANSAITTAKIDIVAPGVVTVTVTDTKGCKDTESKTITQFNAPTASITGTLAFCQGNKTTLTANGGDTYKWSALGGATTQAVDINTPGLVSVTVTDANGCTSTDFKTIVQNTTPIAAILGKIEFCESGKTTLTGAGGSTYAWTGGLSTPSIDVSIPGLVVLTATDGNGCTGTDSKTIIENPNPTAALAGLETFCQGGKTTLTASGGISYAWSTNPSVTTATIDITIPGLVTVIVTDAKGCKDSSSKTINRFSNPTAEITGTFAFCQGGKTTLSATGGDTYLWSGIGGATTQTIDVTIPGIVSVTVTDANGCTASTSQTVAQNNLPTVTITGAGSFCETGKTTLTASSGASYEWTPSATTQSIDVTSPGTVSVVVTDLNGCKNSASKLINENTNPAASITGADAFCQGGNVTLVATGGATYKWSTVGSPTTSSIVVTTPGTVMVTVTDANGCSDVAQKLVSQNPNPTAEITGIYAFCQGEKTTLSATGGESYLWNVGPNATTQTVDVAVAGIVSVIVTDDNGCTALDSQTISQSTSPNAIISGKEDFCTGGSTTLTAGGVGSYKWSINDLTTQSIDVSTAGTVTLTVTNTNGCTDTATKLIIENANPTANISGDEAFCQGGNVSLTAFGGLTYKWSTPGAPTTASIVVNTPGLITVTVSDANGCSDTSQKTISQNPNPTAEITGILEFCQGEKTTLSATGGESYLWSVLGAPTTQTVDVSTSGPVSVTVTDSKGCTDVDTQTISQSSSPNAIISGAEDFCSGGYTTLTAGGGGSYVWSKDDLTTQSIEISSAGTVSVTVTNANGCTDVASKTIIENSNPNAVLTGDNAFCQGKNVKLTAFGGSTYKWSTPGSPTTESIFVSTAGTVTVTVTDVNGCTDSDFMVIDQNNNPFAEITGTLAFCQGKKTTLSATGGSTYKWSDIAGTTTQTIDVAQVGTITVTVTDENGCSDTDSKTITQSAAPVAIITGETDFCAGGYTVLTGSGGGSYKWSDGQQTTQTIDVSTVGTVFLTVTNTSGCEDVATVTITKNEIPIAVITGDSEFCEGGNVTLTASGGSTYKWSTAGNPTTKDIVVSQATTVSVQVTDVNGCTDTAEKTIIKNNNPAAEITGVFAFCQGTKTTLSATGGEKYKWSDAASTTTQTIDITAAGTITVTVTDGNGCSSTDSKVVVKNNLPIAAINGKEDFCQGGKTTLTASGGVTYQWSPTVKTAEIEVTTAGPVTVTVTDANNCTSTASKTITQLPNPIVNITGDDKVCQGSNAIWTATGGVSYVWSPTQTGANITVSNTGTYQVLATSANGCIATASKAFEVKPKPNAGPAQTVTCYSTGTAILAAQGVGSWSLGFSAGTAKIQNPTNPSSSVTDFSVAGVYTLVWTVDGCKDTTRINVGSQCDCPITNNQISLGNKSFCKSVKDLKITGSAASPAGGAYEWEYSKNGGNFEKLSGAITSEFTTGILEKGTHTFRRNYITNTGIICSVLSNTIEISVKPEPIAAISGLDKICGTSIELTATGGNTYKWSNGSTTDKSTALASGSYTVTVTDLNNCESSLTKVVTINPIPVATISGPKEICEGSTATLTANGGQTYVWSLGQATTPSISTKNPGTYSVVVTDLNNCTATASTDLVISANPTATIDGPSAICKGESAILKAMDGVSYKWSLSGALTQAISVTEAGIYTVTVIDAAGCPAIGNKTVIVTDLPIVTITGNNKICSGSSTVFTANGGSTYSWSPTENSATLTVSEAKTYTVVATDLNGCKASSSLELILNPKPDATIIGNSVICEGSSTTLTTAAANSYKWSTDATSPSISVKDAKEYSVTVTDANGCTNANAITVSYHTTTPAAIDGPKEICLGGIATFTASNGSTYKWASNETTKAITKNTSGTYIVTVTDANGCEASASITLNVTANPIATITGKAEICEGGSSILSTSGGTSYKWSTDETTAQIMVTEAKEYKVTVIDANNCEAKGSFTVSVSPKPIVNIDGLTTFCFGDKTTLTASGGNSYAWSNTMTTAVIEIDQTSSLTVTASNAAGCTSSKTIQIVEKPELTASIAGQDEICQGASTKYTATGGTSYLWSLNAATTAEIVVNTPGIYIVTVTNDGCSTVVQKELKITNNPTIAIDGDVSICQGQSTTLTVDAIGTYKWSTGSTDKEITVSKPEIITVIVTDASGCILNGAAEVTLAPNPTASIEGAEQICVGGSTIYTAKGGGTYEWTGGLTTSSITVNKADTYTVKVTSVDGCTSLASKTLVIATNPTATIDGKTDICAGEKTILTAVGGVSYKWSTPDITPNIEVSASGEYKVTVTDASGCEATGSKVVNVHALPTVSITGDLEICKGETTQLSVASGSNVKWSDNSSNATLVVAETGKYKAVVSNSFGCSDSATVDVKVYDLPVGKIVGNDEICLGTKTTFIADGGISYKWENKTETTPEIIVDQNGIYTVTITDINNCSVVVSKELKVVANPQITVDGKEFLCAGSNVELSVAPGAKSYKWSNDQTTNTISVLNPGTYSVTITDQSGCILLGSKKVELAQLPSVAISGDNEICKDESTTLTATLASSYLWSTGENSQSIIVKDGKKYTVIITDANGCQNDDEMEVIVNYLPTAKIDGNLTFCTGGSTTLTAEGGNTYQWSIGGFTTSEIIVNQAVTVLVTVTDTKGCKASTSVQVTESSALNAAITGNDNICQGGTTILTASGGSTYDWGNGNVNQTLTVDKPGTYVVTVSDGGTCKGTASMVVSEVTNPTIAINGNVNLCEGDTTTLSVAGGTSYSWSVGGGLSTQSIEVTKAGLYEVTMTDAGGCKYKGAATVVLSPAPQAILTGAKDFCAGTTINVKVTGGVSYKWHNLNPSDNLTIDQTTTWAVTVTGSNGCTSEKSGIVTEVPNPIAKIIGNPSICQGSTTTLFATGGSSYKWFDNSVADTINVNAGGTYAVTVTNSLGCSDITSHTVVIDNNPTLVISGDTTICEGEKTVLSVSGNGTYTWSGGGSTSTIEVAKAGLYEVTMTDAGGCVYKGFTNVILNANPVAQVEGANDFCEGRSATLFVSGNGTYKWHDGSTDASLLLTNTTDYSVTVTNANGCVDMKNGKVNENMNPVATITGDTTVCQGEAAILSVSFAKSYEWSHGPKTNQTSITNAGEYVVTVTDDKGCSTSATINVEINPLPTASIAGVNNICEGETTIFTATGGSEYLWSNGQKTSSIKPDKSGDWEVIVTDANGCKDDATLNLTINDKPNAGVDAELKCYKSGFLTLNAEGVGQWSVIGNPAGCKIEEPTDPKSIMTFSKEGYYDLIWNVGACTDTVRVSAKALCDCPIFGNEISAPNPNVYCKEVTGIVLTGTEANPSNGEYLWVYSFNNSAFVPASGANNQKDYIAATLSEGTHAFRRVFTVLDPVNCDDTSNVAEIVVRPASLPLPFDMVVQPTPICLGDSILLSVEGESSTSFVWSVDRESAGLQSSFLNNTMMWPTEAGLYKVSVRQVAKECEITSDPLSVEVLVNALPSLSLGPDSTICELDGPFKLQVEEFNKIEWTNGSNQPSITIEEKGLYGVTVTNQEGCSMYDEITLKHFCCKIYHPNIINVNSKNAINREFKLSHTDCVIESKLRIFDRWGNLVYKSDDGLAPWDGKFKGEPVEQGVYTFIFNYKALDEDEQVFDDQVSGDVTVVR
jgi:gliding motility-associated-like protein